MTNDPAPPPLELQPSESNQLPGREQHVYKFHNGYSASVIRGEGTYGEPDLWELAVIHEPQGIVYDTPVTDNVLGWLDDGDLAMALLKVATLPVRG